jgi:hypothetical protein
MRIQGDLEIMADEDREVQRDDPPVGLAVPGLEGAMRECSNGLVNTRKATVRNDHFPRFPQTS